MPRSRWTVRSASSPTPITGRCCSGSSGPVSSASASTRWPTLVTARSEVEHRDAECRSDQLLPSADAPTQTSNSCVRDLARRRPCNHSALISIRAIVARWSDPQYPCGLWIRGVSAGLRECWSEPEQSQCSSGIAADHESAPDWIRTSDLRFRRLIVGSLDRKWALGQVRVISSSKRRLHQRLVLQTATPSTWTFPPPSDIRRSRPSFFFGQRVLKAITRDLLFFVLERSIALRRCPRTSTASFPQPRQREASTFTLPVLPSRT